MALKITTYRLEHWQQVMEWGVQQHPPPNAIVATEDGVLAGVMPFLLTDAALIVVTGFYAHPALDGSLRDDVAEFLKLQVMRLGVMLSKTPVTVSGVVAAPRRANEEGPSPGGGLLRKDEPTKTRPESVEDTSDDVNDDWLED